MANNRDSGPMCNLIGTSENNGREFQTLAVDPCMWERPSMTESASDSMSEAELVRNRFRKRCDVIGGVNMTSYSWYTCDITSGVSGNVSLATLCVSIENSVLRTVNLTIDEGELKGG